MTSDGLPSLIALSEATDKQSLPQIHLISMASFQNIRSIQCLDIYTKQRVRCVSKKPKFKKTSKIIIKIYEKC